jgi:hypothetical protein
LPLLSGNRRWVEETVFCVTECAREKYFGAAFSEGRPLGAAAGQCRSQLFPVAP